MMRAIAIGIGCAALAMTGCDGGKAAKAGAPESALGALSSDGLEALSGKRIFFGHQSVGWNIIDGLKDIAREKGWAGFDFVEAREAGEAPGFYHAAIGRNGDPLGKIEDFEAIMRGGAGDKADIALMKFCYVDFDSDTDVGAVYEAYVGAMRRLEADFPRVEFIYATVPIVVPEGGAKTFVKRLLGRKIEGLAGNVARERINSMIRAECEAGGKPLFDIALAESRSGDGSRVERRYRGGAYYSLLKEYSTDGGHLNEAGRKAVAASLIGVL